MSARKERIKNKENKENIERNSNTDCHNAAHGKVARWHRVIAYGKLGMLGIIVILIPLLLILFCRDTVLSVEFWNHLPSRVAKYPVTGFLILTLLQVIQVVICIIPGQPIQLASSYMYGIFGGYCIAIIGAALGCLITYWLAYVLGTDAMHIIFGEENVRNYVHKLNSGKALTIVFFLYLVPGLPKDILSYIAGISDVDCKTFLLVSTLGRSPGVLGSLLIGSFWSTKNYFGIAVTAIVCLFILIMCIRNRKEIMAKIETYEDQRNEKTKTN